MPPLAGPPSPSRSPRGLSRCGAVRMRSTCTCPEPRRSSRGPMVCAHAGRLPDRQRLEWRRASVRGRGLCRGRRPRHLSPGDSAGQPRGTLPRPRSEDAGVCTRRSEFLALAAQRPRHSAAIRVHPAGPGGHCHAAAGPSEPCRDRCHDPRVRSPLTRAGTRVRGGGRLRLRGLGCVRADGSRRNPGQFRLAAPTAQGGPIGQTAQMTRDGPPGPADDEASPPGPAQAGGNQPAPGGARGAMPPADGGRPTPGGAGRPSDVNLPPIEGPPGVEVPALPANPRDQPPTLEPLPRAEPGEPEAGDAEPGDRNAPGPGRRAPDEPDPPRYPARHLHQSPHGRDLDIQQIGTTPEGYEIYIVRNGVNIITQAPGQFGLIDIEADQAVIWRGPAPEDSRASADPTANTSRAVNNPWRSTSRGMSSSARTRGNGPERATSGPSARRRSTTTS